MKKTSRAPRVRNFALLFACTALSSIGHQLSTPTVARRMEAAGHGEAVSGLLIAAFPLASLIVRPFAGAAADRLNRKRLTLLSFAGLLAALLLCVPDAGLPLFVAARALHGAAFGLGGAVMLAMAADALPEGKIGAGLGVYGVSITAAMAVGPPLGLFLIERGGIGAPFLAAAATAAMGLPLALLLEAQTPAPPVRRENGGAELRAPRLRRFIDLESLDLAGISFLGATAFAAISGFIALCGEARGVAGVEWFFPVCALAMIAARPVAGRLADRTEPVRLILPGSAAVAAALLLLALSDRLAAFLAAAALCGAGYGTVQPAVQAALFRRAAPGRRGAAGGTNYAGLDAGALAGPIVFGAAAEFLGYRAMFLLALLPIALSAAVALTLRRKRRGRVS